MSAPNPYSRWQRFQFWLVTNLAGRGLRLLLGTCRVTIHPPERVERHLVGREPAIAVTWHRGAVFFLYLLGPYRPAIMVSRSKDGEFLARFLEMMGAVPVRGSSSKGGREALREMVEMIHQGQVDFGATVADGPRGPRYQAKSGMILLASLTGLPLLPIMWSADRVWTFRKAWDHTIIPKPFARVQVEVGRELHYPKVMHKDDLEAARLELEQELNRLRLDLDQRSGYQPPD